jgi:hypothetical protein
MKLKRRIFAGICIILIHFVPGISQSEPEYLLNSGHEITRSFFMGPELKYSKIIESWEYLAGIKIGYIIDHKYGFGLEICGTVSDNRFRDVGTTQEISDINNTMFYGGFYLDYIIPVNSPVQISFPTLLGAGANFLFEKFDNIAQPDAEMLEIGRFIVLEPKINAELNISRVFRLGMGCGYRVIAKSNLKRLNDHELSGILFNVNLKFGGF